jgi:hypothetical protein
VDHLGLSDGTLALIRSASGAVGPVPAQMQLVGGAGASNAQEVRCTCPVLGHGTSHDREFRRVVSVRHALPAWCIHGLTTRDVTAAHVQTASALLLCSAVQQ